MAFGKDPGILVFILGYYTFLLCNSGSCPSICFCGIKFASEIGKETLLIVLDFREVL